MAEDHTLFFANIKQENRLAYRVSPITVANWVKLHLEASGIDTIKFNKAVQHGYYGEKNHIRNRSGANNDCVRYDTQ